jgi:hypothetical protein
VSRNRSWHHEHPRNRLNRPHRRSRNSSSQIDRADFPDFLVPIQCHLLRDIFQPFSPVALDQTFLSPTVVTLAHAAYDERLMPSGELDPVRLAVLADALEEGGGAGELLEHLRGKGAHVRGCWAVDACLDRS